MEDLKEKAFQLLSCHLLFYFRYVDDILLTTPPDRLTRIEILTRFMNAFNSRLSEDNSLNFLNVNLIVDKHRIIFDTYNKSPFSKRY